MGERPGGDLAGTKLRPPERPARFVDRTRLDAVLDAAVADRLPLVLVSAPAGSGKSTLVSAWAGQRGLDVAWLQLEESDADPARFWSSVSAAIGRTRPDVATEVGPLVAGSLGAGQVVVPALVNAVAALDGRLVLVLDDYHLVDDPDVHRGVERLIELAPEQLTTVVVTRADPPFRLGRMRVRGRVTELRAADLRFDPGEAVALLGPAADRLDERRRAELWERTEGWAAGLVLAGLSLARSGDADRFVDTFHGDDQLVAGYLADELLESLDDDERRRMVEAAVLHRLTGPLIDAVTGSTDGATWLDALASRNQLVIRLDSAGRWYRYHHLLRDLLLLEARRAVPDRLATIHRRAADWFEQAGYHAAAVDHLLESGDRDRAMDLMRFVGPDLLGHGQLRTLRNILARIAEGGDLDTICSLLSGWDHYLTGRYDSAERLLQDAVERMPPGFDPMRAMPLRINLGLGRGDVGAAVAGAREVAAADDLASRPSELIAATGAAFAWAGLLPDARAALGVALDRTLAEERVTAHAMALVALAVVELQTDDAAAANAAARRALDFATPSGLGGYHGIAPAIAIRAATGDDPAAALADAEHAVGVGRRATTELGLALVLTLAGDVLLRNGADEHGRALLDEARGVVDRCPDPGFARTALDRVAARHRVVRTTPVPAAGLVEPLSERERAVLQYLPSTLSLREIARELYVSPNTVKTQCSAIYRKLGVTSRHDAVRAARERRLV